MLSKIVISLSIAVAFAGCSSGPSVRIVDQSDSKPSWATLTKTSFESDGKMKFVGYFTADGDSRPSAVINGAGSKARAMPLQAISDDFVEQSGVAEDMHDSSSKLVLSVLRKSPPNIAGLTVVSNYYERVEIKGTDGISKIEIRGYSLAECPVAEYNQAKSDALQRLKGDSKIKVELDTIMAQQRDHALNVDRSPASK